MNKSNVEFSPGRPHPAATPGAATRPSWLVGLLALTAVVWLGLAFLLLLRVEGYFQARQERRLEDEISNLLPLMRQRALPFRLAEEKLLAIVNRTKVLDAEGLKRMARDLEATFGPTISLIAYDPWDRLLINRNVPPQLAKQFFHDLHSFHYDEMSKFRNFHQQFKLRERELRKRLPRGLRRETSVSIREDNPMMPRGIIAKALFSPLRVSPIPFDPYWRRPQDPRIPLHQLLHWGIVHVSIPRNLYRGTRFLASALREAPADLPYPSWTGTVEALDRLAAIPQPVRELVKERIKKGFQQVFSRDGWVVGCVNVRSYRDLISVIFIPPHQQSRSIVTLGMALSGGSLALLLTAGLLFWSRSFDDRHFTVSRKFLGFAVFSFIVPVISLGWLLYYQMVWAMDGRYNRTLRQLQEHLESLDNQGYVVEGDLLQLARDFLDRFPWKETNPPGAEIRAELDRALRVRMQALFIFANNVPPQLFTPGYDEKARRDRVIEVNISQNQNPGLGFLQSLVEIFAISLRINYQQTKQDDRAGDLRVSFLMETVKSFLGGYSGLLNVTSRPDRLVLMRAFNEVGWVYFRIIRDRLQQAQKVLFFLFSRRFIKNEHIIRSCVLNEIASRGRPRLALSNYISREANIFLPVRFSGVSTVVASLRAVAKEGGNQRLPVLIEGRKYLAQTKLLTGLDYAAMAIRPYPEMTFTLWSSPWLIGLAAYFSLLLFLLAQAFRLLYVEPVLDLQQGVKKISDGNFEFRLPVISQDELGELSRNFNTMAEGLKQKEFLERFVSDLAMEAARKTGRSPATRLVASVLFSDIRGFTTLSESHPPAEVVDMLNHYLTRMEEVIQSHDGVIDKFIGDAIMAVFLPAHGKAPPGERAVKAGLDMIRVTAEISRAREAQGKFAVRNGVGVATGRLLMGVLGKSAGRQDFTVTGPTVNLAATMEKNSKYVQTHPVVACPQTVADLGDAFRFRPLDHENVETPGFEVLP